MANLELVGLPNYAGLSVSTVAAASEASPSYAAELLQNDEPARRWRSSSNLPRETVLYWEALTRSGVDADRVALVGTNLGSGSAMVRVVAISSLLGSDPGDFDRLTVNPKSFEASSNLSGAFTDVDDGFSPDKAWIGPTSPSSSWSVRIRFDTPTGTLATGAYRQQFWVYARATDSPPEWPCTLNAKLYEDGTLLADLGTKRVTNATGQWLYWAWDAAELAGAGAKVEILLTGQQAAVGSDMGVGSVVWLYERTADVDDLAQVSADSGWQPLALVGSSGFGSLAPEDELAGRSVVVELPASEYGGRIGYYVWIAEDHAPPGLPDDEVVPAVAPGFVEAGVLVIGTAWAPAYGIGAQSEFLRVVDPSSSARTVGGQTFGPRRRPYREVMLPLSALTDEEARGLAERLLLRHGTRRPVLVRILPDSSGWAELGTVWAELVDSGTLGGAAARSRLRGAFTFRERL
ncbi:MAG: hypothetical protein BWX64_00286 [Acidobacteria bacterium ADurb.Bin051]|nr:MAG: hypothetical protein BWX64_00286 [Acidobacteria bacterium ADurb.Bin051]